MKKLGLSTVPQKPYGPRTTGVGAKLEALQNTRTSPTKPWRDGPEAKTTKADR